MISHTAKLVISIILSVIAIVLFLIFKGRVRRNTMIAMLLCTVGDIFMIDTFKLGDVSTFPGAAFFIAAHIVYAITFIKESKAKSYKMKNPGMIIGIIVTVLGAVILAVAMFVKTGKMQSMFLPLLVYLAIIGWNLSCQFSYAVSEKGLRYFLIAGMLLFLISDLTIFFNMVKVMPTHNDFVWLTYIPAQLLVILFNSDFKKAQA